MRQLPDLLCQAEPAYILEFKLLQQTQHFRGRCRRLRQSKARQKRDCFKHEIIAFHSFEAC
jgi:hypothetical protein